MTPASTEATHHANGRPPGAGLLVAPRDPDVARDVAVKVASSEHIRKESPSC